MAEGVLFDVAKGIIEKAGNHAIQEIGLLWGVKDEIEKLRKTVSTIHAVLLDAEEQQYKNQVKEWLESLKDVIYDADNLLDDISTEALRREVMTRDKKAKEVRIFFSKSNQLAYGFKMGHKVREMRERLDTIAANRKFLLEERLVETQVRYMARETHSFVHTDNVIGREKDREKIMRILLDANVEENVSILPIVGLGGLGKTTLAQLVFNDKNIKKHFERKMWVCVSDNFNVKIIVEKILESAKNKKLETLGMDTLIIDLKKEIDEKRYLLVLDDVWNEDPKKWLSLTDILKSGARGSKILVTTRSNKVAKITQTVPPYMLEGLNEKESWSLFKQMAFEKGQEPENSKFKEIGKEILKKCRGVPLAIRTIGSLLYFKNTEKEWLSFKDSELSNIPQEENDILPTLKLSYDHLPSYLKQCFAYCCLFPKDYKIHKPTLIQMWMAQGFIRPLNQNQCLEDVGHEYIIDLLWRSFFQEVEKDERGNILQFKMHDLMHDLAKLVAGSYSTTCNLKEEIIDEKNLHVSFGGQSQLQIPSSLFRASRIRTFMLQGKVKSLDESIYVTIVASFKFIRLLDLHHMDIRTVPSSIGKLKHLRYLDLSDNSIRMLPNSITRLHNLQTLKLFECHSITKLPSGFTKLVNLRLLEINTLTHIPRGWEQMTSLQALSVFKFEIKRNSGLKDLQGSNELKFPKLQEISLYNYEGVKFPNWMSSLTTLVEFRLEDSNKCQHLPPLEQLPNLKQWQGFKSLQSLEITRCPNLISLPEGINVLTSLQRLDIWFCPKLKSLPEGIQGLTSLQTLEIWHCPKLKSLPEGIQGLTSLQTLEIWDCPKLKSLPEGIQGLTSLQTLRIWHCPKLKSLPEGIQDIWDCPKLKSLPEGIQGLTSLHTLDIWDCPKLKSLPKGIQGLTSLNTLQITSCPILLKRCERETGKDWPKIAHIPNLKGDLRQQQTELSY
ncbi:hypothetical protein ACB092_11G241500 [Castanea dentata]